MKCDIAIGTHNRHKYLIETLKSLKKLKEKHKIFVIDSSDKKLNIKYQKLCDKYVYDKTKKALSKKRNLAIKLSDADYIAFTDDDCIADPEWISNLMKGFEKREVVCCTGATIPHKDYVGSGYERIFGFVKIGKKRKIIKKSFFLNLWRIGHGNNMVFKKDIFNKVGLFDENLGVGSKGLASEDTDMFYRILKKGYFILYNPEAIIYHKHLVKEDDLPKTAYRNGFGAKTLLLKRFDLFLFFTYLALLLKYSIKSLFGDKRIEKPRIRGLLGFKQK